MMTYIPDPKQPRLLEGGPHHFKLNVNNHRVWVAVTLSRFSLLDKTCLKSVTQCAPCCTDVSKEELKPKIDALHIEALGIGDWVYGSYALLKLLESFSINETVTIIFLRRRQVPHVRRSPSML
jgi:hypothetical protein